jgi:hypothetical protein
MANAFLYDPVHQVVVCRDCRTCLIPTTAGQERHLRARPHRLLGDTLKATVQLLSSYSLQTAAGLQREKPRAEDRCPQINGLEAYDGYRCLRSSCSYYTRLLSKMHAHVPSHGKKAKEHMSTALWEECTLQTFFTGKGRIDYFVVVPKKDNQMVATPRTEGERALFKRLEKDYKGVRDDIEEQASIVHDFGDSRSARVPWLERTAFPSHLARLKDEEIKSSYKLPPRKEVDADAKDADLVRILAAAEAVLRDAYQLCSDTSPNRKMTQQRANILNEFYAGASGKADGFRYYKNESSLVKYFTAFKQLLVYYYRVVHCKDGHFTQANPDQKVPKDIIQPTAQQTQAMGEIVDALSSKDKDDLLLKHAVRRLYLALICQTVGSVPFKSPVLSFCAMLSRKVRRKGQGQGQGQGKGQGRGRGLWEDPGSFNSHLSALT